MNQKSAEERLLALDDDTFSDVVCPGWREGPKLVKPGDVVEAPSGIAKAQEALDDEEPGIPWGWRDLDTIVGPMRRGRVVVIGARPSCGKTTMMLNWLNAASLIRDGEKPLRVLAFFTERHPSALWRSWAALRCGYDEDAVLANDWAHLPRGAKGVLASTLESFEAFECERVILSDMGQPTLEDMRTSVRQAQDRFGGLDVVIFDYLQTLRGRDDRHRVWAEGAELFASLAVLEHIAVVVGSQLRREDSQHFDKFRPPTMAGFKGASEIEEKADVAVGLFRPLRRMTAKDERAIRLGEGDLESFKLHDTMAVKVLKHRYRNSAADRLLRLSCVRGRISDYNGFSGFSSPVPDEAGDAWEAP